MNGLTRAHQTELPQQAQGEASAKGEASALAGEGSGTERFGEPIGRVPFYADATLAPCAGPVEEG